MLHRLFHDEQLLPKENVMYLRIADGRGWMRCKVSKGGRPDMVKVAGELIEDT